MRDDGFGQKGCICIVGGVVMTSLSKLHSWVCRVRWGIARLGQTILPSCDCLIFRLSCVFLNV
jgi:hypothetical protein